MSKYRKNGELGAGDPEVTVSTGPILRARAHGPGSPVFYFYSHGKEMGTADKDKLPAWAPRLRKAQIARLYEASGRGLVDEELIDDVGFSLLARAESILAATAASRGRASCPGCKAVVEHDHELLKCRRCGWECSWQAYKKTIKYKHLNAGGMKPFLEEFVEKFPRARSHADRLILIDTLIHRYHWETSTGGGRPGACCLIEGKMSNK